MSEPITPEVLERLERYVTDLPLRSISVCIPRVDLAALLSSYRAMETDRDLYKRALQMSIVNGTVANRFENESEEYDHWLAEARAQESKGGKA